MVFLRSVIKAAIATRASTNERMQKLFKGLQRKPETAFSKSYEWIILEITSVTFRKTDAKNLTHHLFPMIKHFHFEGNALH